MAVRKRSRSLPEKLSGMTRPTSAAPSPDKCSSSSTRGHFSDWGASQHWFEPYSSTG
ncbi:hypothetical protein K443DRAFT_678095 [Laccaria amethystina LaAM-08-1]|uniref:Uncharacterized protein n=1 Tax=Laccaria amethystina LaAM-08-1 TaxID=1095629 RepID=A0A0C9Y155_9AGAR|nr:hypothetical protein K443DRAFT_678095 [Laccaria amethystina LaAM-08-1]